MQDRRTMDSRRAADVDRLARIETRLVQLMIYLGANPNHANAIGGFFDELREELDVATPDETYQANRSDGHGPAPGADWSSLDRPAYLRRGGKCAECPHVALAAQAGNLAP